VFVSLFNAQAAEAEREAAREIQATFELKAQSVAEQAAAAEARAAAAEAKLADWLAESERQEAAAAAASPVSAPTADRDIHDENNYEQVKKDCTGVVYIWLEKCMLFFSFAYRIFGH